jgi:hypothetical protein
MCALELCVRRADGTRYVFWDTQENCGWSFHIPPDVRMYGLEDGPSTSDGTRCILGLRGPIVIVGGLISDLVMSIFLLPTLYVWMAGEHDVLPKLEGDLDEPV